MVTIKGVFKDGEIKLLEAAPVKTSGKVLITFLEEEEDTKRNILQEHLPVMKSFLEEGEGTDSNT